MTDTEFFAAIASYGWGTKTKNYTAIKRDLMGRFTADEASAMGDTFRQLCGRLYKVLSPVVNCLGDDSFGDLIAHIVGMGEAEYNAVMANPALGAARAKDHKFDESFAYAIPFKSNYTEYSLGTMVDRAQQVVTLYCQVMSASENDIPGLPQIDYALKGVVAVMEAFVSTKDVAAFLTAETETNVRGLAETVDTFLSKFNVGYHPEDGSLEFAVSRCSNKWAVWNLFTDVRDYLA